MSPRCDVTEDHHGHFGNRRSSSCKCNNGPFTDDTTHPRTQKGSQCNRPHHHIHFHSPHNWLRRPCHSIRLCLHSRSKTTNTVPQSQTVSHANLQMEFHTGLSGSSPPQQ